jgi:acetolactate synthase I/II/III large subunit
LPKTADNSAQTEDVLTTSAVSPRSGGRILVDALRLHGTDRAFCVPGESYLDVLDALVDTPEIQLVVAKHEGAAALMAEADGKLTGRPGICFVTRGPGASHACVGVHTAFQDSTPMILFIGQVDREFRGREAFQEIDFAKMFAPFAKWSAEIDSAASIPEYLQRAFRCAMSDRPGPIVLSLPEDILGEICSVEDMAPIVPSRATVKIEDLKAFQLELARSQRPLLILGGSGWSKDDCINVQNFAEKNCLPVATSFRRQDLFNNDHPCYAGHLGFGLSPQLADRVSKADLLIALGTRLGDVTTVGYTLLKPPRIQQRLVHIHAGADELGRVYEADLPIHAAQSDFATALSTLVPIIDPPWRSWTEEAHKDFVEFTAVPSDFPATGVNLAEVVSHLSKRLPPNSTVSNGAGNYTVWVHRFFKYKQARTELAPTNGTMGYGLPAAIAAKLRYPDRLSVCFAGDGCFLMYPQELATALQFKAAVIVLVVNNGIYGTIRMHQEIHFPGRTSGTDLLDPNFVALAQSFGAYAERVESTEAFAAAFERAVASQRPALLELCTDKRLLTPTRWLP